MSYCMAAEMHKSTLMFILHRICLSRCLKERRVYQILHIAFVMEVIQFVAVLIFAVAISFICKH